MRLRFEIDALKHEPTKHKPRAGGEVPARGTWNALSSRSVRLCDSDRQ